MTIPAFLNPHAGTAAEAARLLGHDPRFAVREVEAHHLQRAILESAETGVRRVAVCGGDGTVGTAARAAVQAGLELAVIPGGTLNHFAKRVGIPTELEEAIHVAAGEHVRRVDVGYLGDHLFLNTSSVGAYVAYVRLRERTERWLGYRSASALAALRLLFRLRSSHVRLELDGKARVVATPLLFIGVGERRLVTPRFGEPVRDGDRALHVILVNGRESTRHLVTALAAAARGVDEVSRSPTVESYLRDNFIVELPLPRVRVALDGEVHMVRSPLRYRIAREQLIAVTPPPIGRRKQPTE